MKAADAESSATTGMKRLYIVKEHLGSITHSQYAVVNSVVIAWGLSLTTPTAGICPFIDKATGGVANLPGTSDDGKERRCV